MRPGWSDAVNEEGPPVLGRHLAFSLLDLVGRAIVDGRYSGVAFPTEIELARQHGVSRAVSREAVKMLSAKGLVAGRPGQGTWVQPASDWNLLDADILRWTLEKRVSPDLLRQFTQLRLAIEPESAALAAVAARPADVTRIDAALGRMAKAEEGLDDPLEADIDFHVAVLRASNNPFYGQLGSMVRTALRSSIRFTNSAEGRTASLADHTAVRDAIARGDADGARVAMRALVGDVARVVERRISNAA